MLDFLSNLCLPAMVYLIIVIIYLVIGMWSWLFYPQSVTLLSILFYMIGLFMELLWIWLLNFICSKNMEGLSWFLFFLPYIIIFIIVAGFWNIIDFKNISYM